MILVCDRNNLETLDNLFTNRNKKYLSLRLNQLPQSTSKKRCDPNTVSLFTKVKRLNILKRTVSNAIKQARAGAAAPSTGVGRNFTTNAMLEKNTAKNIKNEKTITNITLPTPRKVNLYK